MTDGMMLREFLGEPDMASYNVIMVDEVNYPFRAKREQPEIF